MIRYKHKPTWAIVRLCNGTVQVEWSNMFWFQWLLWKMMLHTDEREELKTKYAVHTPTEEDFIKAALFLEDRFWFLSKTWHKNSRFANAFRSTYKKNTCLECHSWAHYGEISKHIKKWYIIITMKELENFLPTND